jgi:hypothetical protein
MTRTTLDELAIACTSRSEGRATTVTESLTFGFGKFAVVF